MGEVSLQKINEIQLDTMKLSSLGREKVLPKKLGRGVWPGSQNPYPIYD